jgi:hypothetical protein|tara:strand:- start:275 stop:1111 length:837 start_codon:yes stop_codon:yes gene_type:complete
MSKVRHHNPGLLFNQSAEEYHADMGASASRLNRMFKKSPAHMRHDLENPKEPTQAMVIGTATHSAILEPDLFEKEWGRIPVGDGRSKEIKEAKANLVSEFGRDNILKAEVYDGIVGMRESVLGHARAADLLSEANTEVSSYWTDEKTGVQCKARIDAMPCQDSGWGYCLVDIKTTADASAREFQRSVYNFGYHRQAAHYLASTADKVFGRDRFIFIVVERDSPHCVAVYELDSDALALARAELDDLLGTWGECEVDGGWPSYPEDIQELSLPGWAYTR